MRQDQWMNAQRLAVSYARLVDVPLRNCTKGASAGSVRLDRGGSGGLIRSSFGADSVSGPRWRDNGGNIKHWLHALSGNAIDPAGGPFQPRAEGRTRMHGIAAFCRQTVVSF